LLKFLSGLLIFGGMLIALGQYARPSLKTHLSRLVPYALSVSGSVLFHYVSNNSRLDALLATAVFCAINALFHLVDWMATKYNWERY
jgi:hypothetical protein